MSVSSRLRQIALPYSGTLIAALVLLVITTFLNTVVFSILLANLLFLVIGGDAFAGEGMSLKFDNFDLGLYISKLMGSSSRLSLLIGFAVICLVVMFIKCACQARHNYLMNKFAYMVARDIRQRLFNHILTFSPAQFERQSTGGLLSRITGDVGVLQQSLGLQLSETVQAPLAISFALLMMLKVNWMLTIAVLCLVPLISALIVIAGRKIRKLVTLIQDRLASLNSYLAELLSSVRTIQSFTREPFEMQQVSKLNEQYFRDTMRSVMVAETLSPATEFIGLVGAMLGICLGGAAVLTGSMPPQYFLIFFYQAQQASSQSTRLARINQLRQQMNGSMERIFALLDTESTIKDARNSQPLPLVEGKVTFDNVSFRYSSGEQVLSDVTFDAQPEDIIALVGPSGSGKSTIVNLIPRFYDPTDGHIIIDGWDLREITLASLREQVGAVPQDTILFSGSIRDNILYGKLDASEEELIEAARAANALEFIKHMPEGFDTLVGERGARLSGGQRQRIAIARALLKNPRILILDEATSALDTESEHLVQQALERLMQGRTTFVIAHRLSTIQHATRILVLDGGRIVESGDHNELQSAGGLYSRLYDMQFRKVNPQSPEESSS